MYSLFKLVVRLALILLVVYIAVKPYNWFCKLSSKCSPLHLEALFQKKEVGAPFDVAFEVKNLNESISFEADAPMMQTVFNRKSSMAFYIKNISARQVTFRPQLVIEPVNTKQYVEVYDCLCSQEYTLKAGESIKTSMEFMVDSDMMNASDLSSTTQTYYNNSYYANAANSKPQPKVTIRYEIKPR